MAVLQPAETLPIKDILRIKDEGKIKLPSLPVMKCTRKTKAAALYLPFLINDQCDSTDPWGYHIQVNDPKRLPGTSNEDYTYFHDWMVKSKEYACISTKYSHNTKLAPYSSS